MADVYLAEQGSLRRQIAFKVLKRELAADQTYVRRFHMEAQAAAALVQANIVQIYEVGCVEGWHYIAQEYVEGQNLAQFISRQGMPDVKLGMAVMRQVVSALCKSAERGIVHRDIKPENIMLARSGEVKVADFGLARVGAHDDAVKLTQVGITMGTPLYMSPEQVEGKPLDCRSDIYSLGVTCFHMLTGQPPFRGDTALSVALQHVRKQPDRLENLRPDLPPSVCRIIHKMLAKDPGERYQNPRELLTELRGLQIEGVDLQWPAEMDEFNTVETAALGTSRLAATQRLQTMMEISTKNAESRRRILHVMTLIAVLLASLLLGAAAAWAFRGRFLLDTPQSAFVPVAKLDSAQTQLEYASYVPRDETEAALRSVEYYYPGNTRTVLKSKEELAKLYLTREHDPDPRALPLFVDLANARNGNPESEKQAQAFGMIGQSIIYYRRGNAEKSAELISDLATVVGSLDPGAVARVLDDREMDQLASWLIRSVGKASGKVKAEELEKWLNSQPSDESGSP